MKNENLIVKRVRVNDDGVIEKRCTNCGEWLIATRDFFSISVGGLKGLQSQCKVCLKQKATYSQEARRAYCKRYHKLHKVHNNKMNRKYYRLHRGQVLIRQMVTQRKRSQRLKEEALKYYSIGNKVACVNCGFSNIDALTIDHVNGGGNKHRRQLGGRSGVSFYYWLAENKYPEGYRTLCMNCQFIKLGELHSVLPLNQSNKIIVRDVVHGI
ncbi:hypothetical protein LCGC14_0340970 [marine sediment metagenome]|uniref:Uncharacterized protein n=1 Tax=marine sediment metagenome TaxID=412755 RepID=A0A0F9TDL8_9ZZZZ